MQNQDSSTAWVSQKLPGSPSKLPKSRSIGPVGVWEAHKSRSVVPVGVWKPPGMLRSHDLSCLSVFGSLPDGFLTCSGAPQAPLGGSWRLLAALGACKIKIQRPCRCLGGSQITICRACRCLEASRNAPKSRSIVPVGVWRPPGWLLDVFWSATSSSWRILEALELSELPKSRSIGPVGVWEAHKSRSVVPVGVWRPPGML